MNYRKIASGCVAGRKGFARMLSVLMACLFLGFGLLLANLNQRAVPYMKVKPYIHHGGFALSNPASSENFALTSSLLSQKEAYTSTQIAVFPKDLSDDTYGVLFAYSSNWAGAPPVRQKLLDGQWFTQAPKEEGQVNVVIANSDKTHYQVGDIIDGNYEERSSFPQKLYDIRLKVCGVLEAPILFQQHVSPDSMRQTSDFWRNTSGTDFILAASYEEMIQVDPSMKEEFQAWLIEDISPSTEEYK